MSGDTRNKLTSRTNRFFVSERYMEDANHGHKSVPDLVESIMKGSGLVKEEFCTFEMPRKISDLANVASEPAIVTPSYPIFAVFGRASGQL